MGKIPEGYLPPKELWPTRAYKLPEYQAYPQKFNSTEELLDKQVVAGRGDRPAILFEDRKIPYKALLGMVNKFGSSLKALGVVEAAPLLEELEKAKPDLKTLKHIIVIGGSPEQQAEYKG